jgi:hypothetical protein
VTDPFGCILDFLDQVNSVNICKTFRNGSALRHQTSLYIIIPSYHLYWTDCFLGRIKGTASAVRKGMPYNKVDLVSSLVSIEAIRVHIPISNSGGLLAAVYKSPGCAWNDADIIELLSFTCKSLLPGDPNA